MKFNVKDQIIVNVPAREVWRVLAHQFDQAGVWSSGIDSSEPLSEDLMDEDRPEGAPVYGRVCYSSDMFGDASEKFTFYDEGGMRFGYAAIGDMPFGFNDAENKWRVEEIDHERSLVGFDADVDMKWWIGIVMWPLKPIFKKMLGTRTLEELKFYVETGMPHPRNKGQ